MKLTLMIAGGEMRKIKFRVWNQANHRMFGIDQLAFGPDGELVSIYSNGPDFSNDPDVLMGERPDLNEAVLMQYIGLKDVNGKEIYEGDIVKVTVDNDSYIAEVKYYGNSDYPAFDIEPPESYYYESNVISNAKADEIIEVIGNIHENPELLEKEK